MFDFAADGRDEGGKHGVNQKGLVTIDRQTKKDAFYLYKAYWNKTEPFVHLCGSRYVDRAEDVTEIKVYSNQNSVTLLVDGAEFASASGSHIFIFHVPITGEHLIEVRCDSLSDKITVRKVDTPNPSYRMDNRKEVVNWFDADPVNLDFYSVQDTLNTLRENPRSEAIVNQMMEQGAQSRGDVADAVKDNPSLIRMMGRMTLISLLKQGGADEESIKQLNRILQGIPKSPAVK